MHYNYGTLGYQLSGESEQPPFLESPIGMLNLIETCLALTLFGGLLKQDSMSTFHHFLCCSAATYFFNDFCFFFTSLLSRQSAACMPSIFYYTMFQFTSFATFVPCGIYANANVAEPTWIVAVSCIYGTLHGIHFAISVYQNIADTSGYYCYINI
ncbi:uncharacterized protein [Dermacentor albipictus]|uniref:uncharacterized protein n=1 Tax=Dermacentor albipictus TaxID=60249 RepID=UPI0031FC93C2